VVRLVLLSAVLATFALSVTPAQAGGPCSLSAAKRALAAHKVRNPAADDPNAKLLPSQADAVICFDFTRDRRVDMAVTIASGGTAGDIAFAVFRGSASGWSVALVKGGYKLGLARVGGDLVQTQPVYRPNDANCCPSGGFDHVRWRWNGSRFVVARSWHGRTFRP
jgi:hypothetical protein